MPRVRKGGAYHHGDLRRALLKAAGKLIEKHGPEGFTLRAASRIAGVSDGAPYYHFTDKDGLLAAVAEEGFRELYRELEAAFAKHPGNSRQKSQAMGVAYVVFAATHPAQFRVMFGRLVHDRDKHPELAEAAGVTFQLVRDAVIDGLDPSESKLPPQHVLYATWGLVHGLAFLAIDGHFGSADKDPARLRKLVWGAIRALDPHKPRGK